MNKILLINLMLLFAALSFAQVQPTAEEAYQKKYNKRIKKEYIYGVYIPKDLADAFVQLNRLTDQKSKTIFKNMPEELAAKKLHFSLGRWMIYNWGFYEGSRLSDYIKKLGITHPDDMASFIITSYHRNLHKKKLDIKTQIEFYKNKRKKEMEARKKRGTVISQETRIRPKKTDNQ